jgi:uncharacterized membrane protein YgcG
MMRFPEVTPMRRSAGRSRRRGAILLEVLLALTLLILGMAFVGAQVNLGLKIASDTELATRAVMLAESKIAELDAGVVPIELDEETEGDFGMLMPGWAWRMYVEPTDTPDLYMITLQVYYSRDYEVGDQPDFMEMRLVHTCYTLRATPARLDLARDFGLSETQLQDVAENVPIPDFDPADINPAMLANLDADMLEEYLPLLMDMLGKNSALLNSLPQATRDQIQNAMDRRNQGAGGSDTASGGGGDSATGAAGGAAGGADFRGGGGRAGRGDVGGGRTGRREGNGSNAPRSANRSGGDRGIGGGGAGGPRGAGGRGTSSLGSDRLGRSAGGSFGRPGSGFQGSQWNRAPGAGVSAGGRSGPGGGVRGGPGRTGGPDRSQAGLGNDFRPPSPEEFERQNRR